ncbi:GIY-YIG nuclease family protein, partial [Candidatus Parcubacteria bacterium]|nr:GIY-YIG nuclease family protein [Candidatus Parcubacteria bacterium]
MATFENKIKNLSQVPGIYLFYNKDKELIYVGKATSLRSRVGSYFSGRRTSRPIEQMIHEVTSIKTKETDSVLEAVILEGSYIKKYRPKYNIDWKDDKSWNYIVVTKEDYPKVKTLRAHEYEKEKGDYLYIFGPYPGLKTREMMKLLERLFFISTCKPNAKRECLYHQMGQCLGVCTGEINAKEYKQKVIRPLAMFLRGNKKGVIKNLEKKMKEVSKAEDFEEAARLRNQISALQRIQDIALLNKTFFTAGARRDSSRAVHTRVFENQRIEGYDISNLGTSGKVGSMVVFDSHGPVKSEYRKFKIKGVEGQSDVDCLAEILERRLQHVETQNIASVHGLQNIASVQNKSAWQLPNIILVDGGLPQVNRAKKILKENKFDIPVVGIAKGPARKKNEF